MTGWDDPRMPTLAGLRRRGYTPEAIRAFCERIGVSKRNSVVDVALLEHAVREDLNARCRRVMGVVRPLRVVLENYPEGQEDALRGALVSRTTRREGGRSLPFGRVLYIDRDDFAESAAEGVVPPDAGGRGAPPLRVHHQLRARGQGRARRGRRAPLHLGPGLAGRQREGRPQGEGHAPLGLGGARGARPRCGSTTGSSRPSGPARARGVERGRGGDFLADLNPDSLTIVRGARVEPALAAVEGRGARAVRARRLLLRRPRLAAGRARLQPHDRPARLLGGQAGTRTGEPVPALTVRDVTSPARRLP